MNEEKTLSLIREKEVKVKAFNKTHKRISVMIKFLANGKSLKSFLVFKDVPRGPKEKQLKYNPKVKAGYIYVCCHENS